MTLIYILIVLFTSWEWSWLAFLVCALLDSTSNKKTQQVEEW